VREIVKHCRVFELNTGAIARGLRTVPYPAGFLLDEIRAAGGWILVNSDCHYRARLTCWFDEAETFLAAHGFERHDNQRLNDRIGGVTLWK
jgi:histidinol-phosphatase (PHP family)